MDVEALEISETFASVEYDRMNGVLNFSTLLKGDIYHGTGSLTEGREPVSADEICGPPAFFERMGADPVIGNTIEISFRPHGEGMAETRQFVICGLVTQVDMSKLDVSDSRISYSADISEALVEEYFGPEERSYNAAVRILGEEELTYDEIVEKIGKVAEDIGYDAEKVSLNKGYLYTMTESGGEMMPVVGGVTLLVILFAGLVIYSIYYVSVITDIQEIGRLKALGASDKQIKKALDWISKNNEHMSTTNISLTYDSSTGKLSGTITVNYFAMNGNGVPYEEPDISGILIGSKNIFGTVK